MGRQFAKYDVIVHNAIHRKEKKQTKNTHGHQSYTNLQLY